MAGPYPVVVLRDGTRLIAPTMRVVATVAGLTVAPGLTAKQRAIANETSPVTTEARRKLAEWTPHISSPLSLSDWPGNRQPAWTANAA